MLVYMPILNIAVVNIVYKDYFLQIIVNHFLSVNRSTFK